MLWEISKQIEGHTICALADGAAWPVQGTFLKSDQAEKADNNEHERFTFRPHSTFPTRDRSTNEEVR